MKAKQSIMMALAAAAMAASAAQVACTVDGTTSTFDGQPHGLAVTLGTTGGTVEYAESATGPWQTAPVEFTDVCTDRYIWVRASAAGYDTVVASNTVTITPKMLDDTLIWLTMDEDYVYDGTAKTPYASFSDPAGQLTEDDFELTFENNVDAGTATATFTGKGNYTGTVTEDFEIAKADNGWKTAPQLEGWTYGQSPRTPVAVASNGTVTVTYSTGGTTQPTLPGTYTATFTVPASRNYNALSATVSFTIASARISCVADPQRFAFDHQGHTVVPIVTTPADGYTLEYALSTEGPWQTTPILFTNTCSATLWYRVTATGYETVVGSTTVTITAKTLDDTIIWLTMDEDYVYDGTAKMPYASFSDPAGQLTEDDFELTFENNINAGTATATFTGKGNYTGTVTEGFEIAPRPITLTSGNGTWEADGVAHSNVTVTVGGDGFVAGEGATYSGFPEVSEEGTCENTFTVTFNDGTLASNYTNTLVYGTLTITAAPEPAVTLYEETDEDTIYKWEATGATTAKIVGFKNASQKVTEMVLPDKIDGYFITEIARGAFANSTCGATSVTLPRCCTKIGFRAFSGIKTLARVTFVDVLDYADLGSAATLEIGEYAFAATALTSVSTPSCVSKIGNYAFADCRKLTAATIEGGPTLGTRPFRRAGIDTGAAPTVTVGTPQVSDGAVLLSVAVTASAPWGAVDADALAVEYRATLDAAPTRLAPKVVSRAADGTVTVEVTPPQNAGSGFFTATLAVEE